MNQTWKWIAVAALAGVAIYLGTLVVQAQQPPKADNTEKLEAIAKQLDDVSKKLDEMSKKLDTIQGEVHFIKARGKG